MVVVELVDFDLPGESEVRSVLDLEGQVSSLVVPPELCVGRVVSSHLGGGLRFLPFL